MSQNLPKIKICGIKTVEAAQTAVQSGASLIGMIFYPPSPRFVTPEVVEKLSSGIRRLEPRPALVGVYVNVPLADMAAAAERYGFDYVQLSGEETPEQVAELSKVRPVVRALRLPAQIGVEEALRQADAFGRLDNVTLLLDTHKKGSYGGTGETGDWAAARAIAARYPTLLAGGLNAANVAYAIEQVQPWGLDVSSGVERDGAPGEKDLNKIKEFCAAARSVRL
jgi:phosphoribosylanthranilate isomerase